MSEKISLIGFGEAAQTFTSAATWKGETYGYDILLEQADRAEPMLALYAARGVTPCPSNAAAVTGAKLIASLVTANQTLEVARETACHLSPGALFLDMNSVSPDKKQAAARLIERAGGFYVDVAIMAPVQPAALDVPLLVSGRDATRAKAHLAAIGFTNVQMVGDRHGDASVIKMIRSVMIKGIEALTAECFMAAERAGVTSEVLHSLDSDWAKKADYNLDRMLIHGQRRAAEMEEVCATLEGLGVDPVMTRGTVSRQRLLGQIGAGSTPDTFEEKLRLITPYTKAGAA